MTKKERWILSEWQVALDRVENHNDTLIWHRQRTPYSEVDLLFARSMRELWLVEVKSWNSEIYGHIWGSVVSNRQLVRLCRARDFIEAKFKLPTVLKIAVVTHGGSGGGLHYFDP